MNDKLDLQPVFSRIIIKRKEVEKIGSIIVPDSVQSMKSTEGTVLAVGNEVDLVKVGDTVYFGLHATKEIERNGEKFLVCNEEDIIAFVDKPE